MWKLFGPYFVEAVRLAMVLLWAAVSLRLPNGTFPTGTWVVLCISIGYVLGGVVGRWLLRRSERLHRQFDRLTNTQIIAGILGLIMGGIVGLVMSIPLLMLGAIDLAAAFSFLLIVLGTFFGSRVGEERADDLMRFLGAGGRRLNATMPSGSGAMGSRFKYVDTSALIDGRIVQLCATSFIEGDLVVPNFVLDELQALADSQNPEKRRRGQRGLDVLGEIQQLNTVGVIVIHDNPDENGVDAKLLALAEETGNPILTTDGNLVRVAEVRSIPARNINRLAECVRPPVTVGDQLSLRITKIGRDPSQGVGFLADGSMVVVANASDLIGDDVPIKVTSLTQTSNGRMIFAVVDEEKAAQPAPTPGE